MTKFFEFKNGCMQELPLMLGVFPFGIAFGILGVDSGLSFLQTMIMSSIVFAGASQILFAQLIASGSPYGILVSSVAVVNLRHILYGLSLRNYLKNLSLRWRIILSYLITDESFAISYKRFSERKSSKFMHYHLLGSGITLWFTWQISTFLGIWFGHFIPEYFNLEFAIPLSFLAIITLSTKKIEEIFVIFISSLLTLILKDLPWNLWLIISALSSIFITLFIFKINAKK